MCASDLNCLSDETCGNDVVDPGETCDRDVVLVSLYTGDDLDHGADRAAGRAAALAKHAIAATILVVINFFIN